MLETNLRIVHPGTALYICVRPALVTGPDLTPDLLERACGALRSRHGLAAVPLPGARPTLVVATDQPVPSLHLEDEDWELDVADAGEPTRRLAFGDPDGPELLAGLIRQALLARLARRNHLWRINDSTRIWYEPEPFRTERGIAAYRRYEVATLAIPGVGIGVAVDLGTAFFTAETLAYYFDPTIAEAERRGREREFARLTTRQAGQKGTLLYDNGQTRTKCYFEAAPRGMTCATSGKIRARNQGYPSLHDYYRAKYPQLSVAPDAQAIKVSFTGLGRPQPVAAERVWARVMNDDVPGPLGQVDKIAPGERRAAIQRFWDALGPRPFGRVAPGLRDGFWCPDPARISQVPPLALAFGQGRCLPAPASSSVDEYRAHYQQRRRELDRVGCYHVPPALPRTIYCAYPEGLGEDAPRRLAEDVAAALSRWTGRAIDATLVPYASVADATAQLSALASHGVALIVLNEEPAAYYEVARGLPAWRIKRVTERTLREKHDDLTRGAWDPRRQARTPERGRDRWRGFITPTALDALQLFDVVPFRPIGAGPYEAQLAIDVGHDRRHLALSLLVSRAETTSPAFCIASEVHVKPDQQHEAINPVQLADHFVQLVEATLPPGSAPLASLVVLRDGKLTGEEIASVDAAAARLRRSGRLAPDARVDLAQIHKDTLKSLRQWEVDEAGAVANPLEGHMVEIDAATSLINSTGAATLTQGTADPWLVVLRRGNSIADVAVAALRSSQLNWASPGVAQRLPLELKRADEELGARSAQEIRRLR